MASILAGTKIGGYEVVGQLGSGGMGEVYRARDVRLKRDVAIKVLPTAFAGDAQRMARFEREAQVLASLNHPNIAHIYGVVESASAGGADSGWASASSSDGARDVSSSRASADAPKCSALVMELVEGATLGERIARGPIAVEEAAVLAKQVAEGLEYAHDKGIIHRDLKPANIKVTPEGQVKVLDFGLAKALSGESSEADLGNSPTITTVATRAGVLLGTAGYMSPEQAKGKAVDRRTDIWAFGCVLFEMLTGKAAFDGETITDKLAAVVRAEPELEQLPEKTPGRVRELVRRCLIKDSRQRLQAIGEARIALEKYLEGSEEETGPATTAGAAGAGWLGFALGAAGIAAALAMGALWWTGRKEPEAKRVVKSYIKPAADVTFLFSGLTSGFSLSPDGSRLAYVAQGPEGRPTLWIRPLDSLSAQSLTGTQDANFPFWSADGKMIGFFAEGKLKTVNAGGGPIIALADAPNARGGTWNQYGEILFAPNVYGPLYKVAASGGTVSAVTKANPERGDNTNRWPVFLPDGKHFLYLSGTPFGSKENPANWVRVGSMQGDESKNLIHSHGSVGYAPGHILFLKMNTLMAQPFDEKKMEVTGEPVPIADPVQEEDSILRSTFSVSLSGQLAYAEGTTGSGRELVWFDRTGKRVGDLPGAEAYRTPRVSPDGKRVTYTRSGNGYDIWSYDVARGVKTQLTFGYAVGQANLDAVWTPDGKRIAYTSVRNGKYGFYAKAADGSGTEEMLLPGEDTVQNLSDWSQDGKYLAVQRQQRQIYILNAKEHTAELFEKSPFAQSVPAFSPDVKWLAYCSMESGEQKVYVEPFPGPGGKTQVSPGGGCIPRWRRDGKELFYLSTDNKIMSAEVKTTGGDFAVGAVKALFQTRLYRYNGGYDVSADGHRFIVAYEAGQPNAVITLVENWDAGLKK